MKAEDQGLMVPALAPGFHIIYAYAIDAQAATSTNTGQQSSPLIGNISVYGFLIRTRSLPQDCDPHQLGQWRAGRQQHHRGRRLCGDQNLRELGSGGASCTISVTFTPTALGGGAGCTLLAALPCMTPQVTPARRG